MAIIFGILIFFGLFFSYKKNKDLFSPSKWYFLSIIYFFKNIFLEEYSLNIYFIYLLLISLGFVFVILESKVTKVSDGLNFKKRKLINQKKIFRFLVVLSIIPIVTQFYFILSYGNIFDYVNELAWRVRDWQGQGHLQALIKILPLINLIYLILIFSCKVEKKWRFIYIIHLVIVVFFGILSGSRGSSLYVLLNVLILYNYFQNRLTLIKIAPLILLFLIVASVFGVVRNQIKVSDNEIVYYNQGSLKESLQSKQESYGLIGLKGVYDKKYTDLEYGSTFLTTLTNLVPRSFWPEKPPSGGVLLTKHIEGGKYGGTSHYSTGIYTEFIMNFGYVLGPILATLFMIFLGKRIIKHYNILIYNRDFFSLKKLLIAVFLLLQFQRLIGGITFGEFTNLFFSLMRDVFFLYMIFFIMKLFKIKLH